MKSTEDYWKVMPVQIQGFFSNVGARGQPPIRICWSLNGCISALDTLLLALVLVELQNTCKKKVEQKNA